MNHAALLDMESARYEETYAGESQHHLEPLQDDYSNDEDDVIPCDDDVPPMIQHLPPHDGYIVHGEDEADEVVEDDPTYEEEEEEEDDEDEDGTYEEPVVPDDDDDEVMSHDESLADDEDPHLSSDGVNNEVKYQAVVHALQEGKSYSTISKETGVPKSTVGSIKRRWMTKGNLSDGRKHNGRPPKLNSKQLKMIETVLENAPGTLSSTELLKILKFEVSARTIRRAKRAIMEKRCEDRRNSVIAAARSLASQHVPSLNRGNGGSSSSSPLRSQKLLRAHRKRNLGKKEADGVLVI